MSFCLSNKLFVSDQIYDISNLKHYGNWKNKVWKDILEEFSLIWKSKQYHTKKKQVNSSILYVLLPSYAFSQYMCVSVLEKYAPLP